MGILDLLKKNRDEEEDLEDEEVADDAEESDDDDDEDAGGGGLVGRLSMLRNFTALGGSASGILGKVLKRGDDDDEDNDDDDDGAPEPAETQSPAEDDTEESVGPTAEEGGETLNIDFSGEGSGEVDGESEEPKADLSGEGEGESSKEQDESDSGFSNIFDERYVIDPHLRQLAESQEDTSAEELSEDLTTLVQQVEDMMPQQ